MLGTQVNPTLSPYGFGGSGANSPVTANVPVSGSYTSFPVGPPTINTFPVSSKVDEPEPPSMVPVGEKIPVDGSYSSAVPKPGLLKPTIKTRPSGNSVAVWPVRGVVMLPVAVNIPVSGSKSSALARDG